MTRAEQQFARAVRARAPRHDRSPDDTVIVDMDDVLSEWDDVPTRRRTRIGVTPPILRRPGGAP